MNIPSITSITIPSQVKKQLEGLVVDNFDGKSEITTDGLCNFIEQNINSLYSDTFGENLPLLSDDKLQKTVNEYNDCIMRSGSGSFMNNLNIQDAQHKVSLFIQSLFISKMVSHKLDEKNSENKERIHNTLSDYPEKTDYTLIGFGDQGDDKGPKGPPPPPPANSLNRIHQKIKLDIEKLNEDHSILEIVLSVFTGKYHLSAGRHELHGGKVIATVKEENTSSGIIKSTSVDYTLAYDYNNPSKYKDFPMLAALTLKGKTVNIDPRNRNAELLKIIKTYTN